MVIFFFFFFFFQNYKEHPIVKAAFRKICAEKLYSDSYCDMEEYLYSRISKREIKELLLKNNSPIAELYKKPYPTLERANDVWEDFSRNHAHEIMKDADMVGRPNEYEPNLHDFEAKAIVNWIYQAYPSKEQRQQITEDILQSLSELFDINTLSFVENIIFVKNKVEVNVVSSFSNVCKILQELDKPGHTVYYRGHSDANYLLLPSVMRKDKWLAHERDMYNELMIECTSEFNNCSSHLDSLVEMQHYGLPTRLLDITRNPLVALYFVCCDDLKQSGELIVFDVENTETKYPGSDTISILASLPMLTEGEKKDIYGWADNPAISQSVFNSKAFRLLDEIKLEKPAFRDEIEKNDIINAFFVLPEKKNNRIIKQDGAFIIGGLFEKKENPINKYRYGVKSKKYIYIIKANAKKGIMKQLDKFSINKASLFPEIEDVAEYIKGKY